MICLRLRIGRRKIQMRIWRLQRDAAVFPLDPRADKERLAARRAYSHSEAWKQIVPDIYLPRLRRLQSPQQLIGELYWHQWTP